MAVALYSSNARSGGNGSSISFSYTSSAGADRLMLASSISTSGSVTGATYAGAALSSTGGGIMRWKKVGQASGSNTMTFNYSSSYVQPAVQVCDFTGVDQTTPLGTRVVAASSGNTTSTPSVTCPAGGLVVGAGTNATSNVAKSADSPTVLLGKTKAPGSDHEIYGGYRTTTGVLSWSGGSYAPNWSAEAFPVNPAGAGGAFLPSKLKPICQAIQGMY